LRFRNAVHENLHSIDPSCPLNLSRSPWIAHHYGKVHREKIFQKGDTRSSHWQKENPGTA
jgi:hypothetical protein